MKTKEKIKKELFFPETSKEPEGIAVSDPESEPESDSDNAAETSGPIKDEESQDNIDPYPRQSGSLPTSR